MVPPRPKVRWTRLVLLALLVTVVLPLVLEHYRVRAEYEEAASQLPALRAKARAAGLPLGWEDLDPELPPEQNAATAVEAALAEFRRVSPNTGLLRSREPQNLAMKRELLERCAGVLALLEKAVALPHCFVERDREVRASVFGGWEDLNRSALDTPLIGLGALAGAKAEFEARDGRVDSALGWLEATAALARFAGEDPTLEGWAEQLALEQRVVGALQRVLDPAKATRAELARATRLVDALDGDPVWALKGELVRRLHFPRSREATVEDNSGYSWVIRILDSFGGSGAVRTFHPFLQDPELVDRAFQARVLGRWIVFLAEAEAAGGDARRLYAAYDRLDQATSKGTHRIDEGERHLPGLIYVVGDEFRAGAARRALAAQALDLYEYRLADGEFPAKLGVLKTVRIDPFDGKPLRYKRSGKGFVLYSLGENLRDDGGVAGAGWAGDLTFERPPPPTSDDF